VVEKNSLKIAGFRGPELGISELHVDGKGVTVRVFKTGKTIMLGNTRHEPDYVDFKRKGKETTMLSELVVPVIVDDKVVAELDVERQTLNAFTKEDQKLLEILALQVAFAMKRLADLAQLRQSQELFRKVFEEGPIGMSIGSMEHQFTQVNRAFCNMLGYSEKELTRLSFVDVTHPDDIKYNERLGA